MRMCLGIREKNRLTSVTPYIRDLHNIIEVIHTKCFLALLLIFQTLLGSFHFWGNRFSLSQACCNEILIMHRMRFHHACLVSYCNSEFCPLNSSGRWCSFADSLLSCLVGSRSTSPSRFHSSDRWTPEKDSVVELLVQRHIIFRPAYLIHLKISS